MNDFHGPIPLGSLLHTFEADLNFLSYNPKTFQGQALGRGPRCPLPQVKAHGLSCFHDVVAACAELAQLRSPLGIPAPAC